MFICASKFTSNNLMRLANRDMASVATAALVKQLRQMTGSPIKDCMKALEQTNGDIDASKDYLRKKGLAEAEKRVDRSAA